MILNYWLYHYIDRFIGIPIIIFLSLIHNINKIFRDNKIHEIKKILVIKLTMMGDTILLYPAVKSLKEKYKSAKLTVLCSKVNFDIVKMWDFVDEIIVFEFDKFFKNPMVIILQFFLLWKKKFDLGIDFEQWFRITAIILFFSSKYKVGFRTPKQLRHYLFDHWVYHVKNRHEVECFCDIVKSLSIEVKNKDLFLKINNETKEKIKNVLYSHNIEEKKFVVIHPGCGIHGFYREWDIERYVEVAKYIISKYKYSIVLTGNKDDKTKGIFFEKSDIDKKYVLNMIGKTTIEELIALVSMTKLIICGNTGILHIASALNIPTVAIHGPTNPIKWGPWKNRNVVIKSDLSCVPCSYLGFEYSCKEKKCLKSITQEKVKFYVDMIIR